MAEIELPVSRGKMSALLEVALDALKRGWSLVPITPGKKSPPLVKWEPFQQQRPTEAQTRAWWKQWPNANVGVITGRISNLTVIDCDGPEGETSAKRVTGLPPTRVVQTPKGRHLYYCYTATFHTGAAFLPGVDARNDGGYVVAPPSVVDGKLYSVLHDLPVAVLPFTPAEFQAKHRHPPPDTPTDQPQWVSQALSHGAPQSLRNDTATRLAGYLHGKGHPPDVIEAIMVPFAARCQPPMDTRELEAVIRSIGRYAQPSSPDTVPLPQFMVGVNVHVFDWPEVGTRLRFAHLHERSDATTCELALEDIRNGSPKLIYGGVSFNITSARTRSEMAKSLEKRWAGLDWATMLEQACPISLQEFRKGEACVQIGSVPIPGIREWVLWPIIAKGHTTVIHGPGGSGKSTFAQFCALCIEQGVSKVGLLSHGGKVLYLDWENSEEECRRTVAGLQEGMEFTANPTFYYRRCHRPLEEDAEAILDMVHDHEITVVVVDGATYAAGGEKAAKENAGPVFQVLRALGTSNLIIHHEAKDDLAKVKTAYGSVFWREWARHMFELKGSADEDGLDIALFNRKSNLGKMIHPLGYRFEWRGDAIVVLPEDVRDVPQLATGVTLGSRVTHYLGQNGKAMSAAIAADLGLDIQQVKNWLSREKKKNRVGQSGDDWFLVGPEPS